MFSYISDTKLTNYLTAELYSHIINLTKYHLTAELYSYIRDTKLVIVVFCLNTHIVCKLLANCVCVCDIPTKSRDCVRLIPKAFRPRAEVAFLGSNYEGIGVRDMP